MKNEEKNQEKLRSIIQGHIPLILKCGCRVFHPVDDYPFVKCTTCGWINCGTKEELEEARKNGTLMKTLKWQDLTEEEKDLINKEDQEFEERQERDWMEREESLETEIEEDPDYWLDELNSKIYPRNEKQKGMHL